MALIYRAHFAFSKNPIVNSKGLNTSAIYGFLNTLLELLRKEKPTHLAIAFDTKAPTFRKEIFNDYKANRERQPEDIQVAIPIIKKLIKLMNSKLLEKDGYEADDVIGTIATQLSSKHNINIFMMTPDKDFAQLVSKNVFLYKPAFMGRGVDILGEKEVLDKFKINRVDQVIDFLGLQGDSVDNIPGIPGVGPKTAQKLLKNFGSVEGIIKNKDSISGSVGNKIRDNTENALMSKKLVEIARKYGAEYVSHGCTGKGNDQVRFDASIMTLSGDGDSIKIIAPAREWGMTRDEEKEYAAKAGLELREVGDNNRVYSIDRNLWGLAIEGEDLEDTWIEPPEDAFSWTSSVENAPDKPEILELGFDKGIPVSLDGKKLDGVTLIENLNLIAGKHGIGRVDHLENRLVGIKSREVYETPAAIILYNAISALETATLSREQQRIKSNLSKIYSDLVYDGRWFTLLRENIESFMNSVQKFSSGEVKLKLYKGNVTVIGRKSKFSLYDYDMSTYSTTDTFNHQSAEGFIDIYSLPARIQAKKQKFNDL